ncbi:hypothetical protein [Hymenobacter sp. 102]|uniref:hypothetical protein n=1 Tax=Hymenobacter sp. 102 TaxID=3403152 RepID=UPI003CF31CE0
MVDKHDLIEAASKLVQEFHVIEANLAKSQQGSDGVIHSVTITLSKLLYAVSNNLVIDRSIKDGLDQCCVVAVRVFEGSGIDDDLFRIRDLASKYQPS